MGIFGNKKNNSSGNDDSKEVKSEEKKVSTKDLYTDKKEEKETEIIKKRKYGNGYKILIKPLITEKGNDLMPKGKYLFEVSKFSNKIEISKAIQEVYGIKPASVNIISVKGKTVRRGKIKGKRKDRKKAIITLPKGKTISVYEGV